MASAEDFKQAMRNSGVEPPAEIIADGRLHRFNVSGDKPRTENGWYLLHLDGLPAGRFGTWRDSGVSHKWSTKEYRSMTADEKSAYSAKMEVMKKQRDEETAKIHAECREASSKLWDGAKNATSENPYLKRKGVNAYGLKALKDTLLVPVKDMDGVLHSVQFIYPEKQDDGKDKKFKRGTNKRGHFHKIGKSRDNTAIVCEGYATGASLHEATGHAVAVAFDAGNLKPVAEALRVKYPALRLIICADNDQWGEINTGVIKATEAARAVGGWLAFADFQDASGKPTDFNDLHQREGLDEIRKHLATASDLTKPEILPDDENNAIPAAVPDIYSIMSRAGDLKALDVKIEYLVEGLIPDEMITVLYSRSGMGKSTLMTQLCHAVSTGRPFMGLQVRQRECVYLDYENGLAVIVERLKKVQADDHAEFHIWHPGSEPPPPPLDKKEFATLAAIRPGSLVIVDTLKACNDADENKATEMKPIFDKMKQLRRQGLTIIALHHTAKGDDGKFRGSSVIQDQADHCLVLHKVKQPGSDAELDDDDDVSTYRLGTKFKTRARPFMMFLEFDKETELFKCTDDPATEILRQLQTTITELNKSGEPTQKAIIEAAKKDSELEGLGRDAIRKLLHMGDGIHWQSERRPAMKNALVYLPKSAFEHSDPFIASENSNTEIVLSEKRRNQEKENSLQGAIHKEFASILDTMPGNSKSASCQGISVPAVDDCPELSEDDLQAAGCL